MPRSLINIIDDAPIKKWLLEKVKSSDDLNLRNCRSLTSLKDINVSGDLNLEGCSSLKSLPADLRIGGMIYTDIGAFGMPRDAVNAFKKKYGPKPQKRKAGPAV